MNIGNLTNYLSAGPEFGRISIGNQKGKLSASLSFFYTCWSSKIRPMLETPLTFEEECLLEGKLASAGKKAQIACVLGGILYFIFLMIPQKYLPVRGSDLSNHSLLDKGGVFVLGAALVFGGI